MRNRTNYIFKIQTVSKKNETIDSLVCSQEFFKKWTQFQFTGDMTVENYGSNWEFYHTLPFS